MMLSTGPVTVTRHIYFLITPQVTPRWLAWPIAVSSALSMLLRSGWSAYRSWRVCTCHASEGCTFLEFDVNGRHVRWGVHTD